MPRPNPKKYNPDPQTIRKQLDRSGLSPRAAGRQIGVSERAMQYYLSGGRKFLYPVQFALESLPKRR